MIPVFFRLQWQLHKQWFWFATGCVTVYNFDNLFFRRVQLFAQDLGMIRYGALFASVDGFTGYDKRNITK